MENSIVYIYTLHPIENLRSDTLMIHIYTTGPLDTEAMKRNQHRLMSVRVFGNPDDGFDLLRQTVTYCHRFIEKSERKSSFVDRAGL